MWAAVFHRKKTVYFVFTNLTPVQTYVNI